MNPSRSLAANLALLVVVCVVSAACVVATEPLGLGGASQATEATAESVELAESMELDELDGCNYLLDTNSTGRPDRPSSLNLSRDWGLDQFADALGFGEELIVVQGVGGLAGPTLYAWDTERTNGFVGNNPQLVGDWELRWVTSPADRVPTRLGQLTSPDRRLVTVLAVNMTLDEAAALIDPTAETFDGAEADFGELAIDRRGAPEEVLREPSVSMTLDLARDDGDLHVSHLCFDPPFESGELRPTDLFVVAALLGVGESEKGSENILPLSIGDTRGVVLNSHAGQSIERRVAFLESDERLLVVLRKRMSEGKGSLGDTAAAWSAFDLVEYDEAELQELIPPTPTPTTAPTPAPSRQVLVVTTEIPAGTLVNELLAAPSVYLSARALPEEVVLDVAITTIVELTELSGLVVSCDRDLLPGEQLLATSFVDLRSFDTSAEPETCSE